MVLLHDETTRAAPPALSCCWRCLAASIIDCRGGRLSPTSISSLILTPSRTRGGPSRRPSRRPQRYTGYYQHWGYWGSSDKYQSFSFAVLSSFWLGYVCDLNWVSNKRVWAPFLDRDLKWVSNKRVWAPFLDRLQFSELSAGSSPC